jgi:hypothetical protein
LLGDHTTDKLNAFARSLRIGRIPPVQVHPSTLASVHGQDKRSSELVRWRIKRW